jgi:transcriptional regulator with XRE-family HTH domain
MKPVASHYPYTLSTLGDHLRKRRLDLGLRQGDVAAQLAVNISTVTNWEKNYTAPPLSLIPRVIAFLGYDPRPEPAESLSFDQQIVRARQRVGLSQKALAQHLGVDPGTLAKWERGEREPAPEYRQQLFDFFMTAVPYDRVEPGRGEGSGDEDTTTKQGT